MRQKLDTVTMETYEIGKESKRELTLKAPISSRGRQCGWITGRSSGFLFVYKRACEETLMDKFNHKAQWAAKK